MPRAELVNGILVKTCTKCKQTLCNPYERFHGHKETVDKLNSRCKECSIEAARKCDNDLKDDLERRKRRRAYLKKYRAENKDRRNAYLRGWNDRNREYVNKKRRAQHAANPTINRAYCKQRYDAVGYRHRSLENMIALYHLQAGHCPYTGDLLPVPENPTSVDDFRNVEIDHIHPVNHGGTSEFDNLALTTPIMNRIKGDKIGYPHRETMWL